MRQYALAHELTYPIANGLVKAALLMMYCRIFTFHRIKWMVLITGFISAGLVLSYISVALAQCTPLEKTWKPALPGVPTSPLPPPLLLQPPHTPSGEYCH